MGMSASQMRYTMLAGKKSDVEYQGQQINQQRTTLATESSTLNSQLMDVTVPTPPSSDSFTKTTYTYSSNGETYTIKGTQYKSSAYTDTDGKTYSAGTYIVSASTQETTSQGKSSGTSVFVKTIGTDGSVTYQTSTGTVLKQAAANPSDANYATDVSNISQICQDSGIKDANGRSYGQTGYVTPTFFKYSSGGTTYYLTQSDLDNNANVVNNQNGTTTTPNKGISTYYVDTNATKNVNSQLYGASVVWDNDGRMTSMTDANGNTYSLSCTTTSDDAAYKDAMNDYSYKKGLYEQSLNDINAQISSIENQDKKLELKLQDLDTQQQALSTEMDSVKKVIDKNIETSFKAFA